jgi:hypothetical protein
MSVTSHQEHITACVDEVAERFVVGKDEGSAPVELLH